MSTQLIQVRIPSEMKCQADSVFEGMGLKTTDAVRVFIQQCINRNALPFEVEGKIPNAETIASFQEVAEGKVTRYSSTEAMMNDILGDYK